MTKFSDLGIRPELSSFTGDKIKVDKLLNAEILVIAFKIEESKIKTGTKVLTLQIEKKGVKHIMFSGSTILIQMISKVPKDKFPFLTTIIKESEHLEFS